MSSMILYVTSYEGDIHELSLKNTYMININNDTKYIENISKFYIEYGTACVKVNNLNTPVYVYLTNNLSELNILFNFRDYIFQGKFPQYGLYVASNMAQYIKTPIGHDLRANIQSLKNINTTIKFAGILYLNFYSGNFLVLPLNYSKYIASGLIVYSNRYINTTSGIDISGIVPNISIISDLLEWINGLTLVSILVSVWYIFSERKNMKEILWLFIINGVEVKDAFKKLVPVFLLLSFISIIPFVIEYLTVSYYYFPFMNYVNVLIKLIFIIPLSILIELYTLNSVYKDPYKNIKVRDID
ncbi:hypothetical protein DFR85_11935 [Acidianus brierleyi]|nr:hypothetical protein DFR85_11935 [Acidianus brierleyi]